MQGSASVVEDARQPPYLCPVDLAKVVFLGSTSAEMRYRALLEFCEREDLKGSLFFAPFAAWIRGRLELVGGLVDEDSEDL
jgi:archaemetzincin